VRGDALRSAHISLRYLFIGLTTILPVSVSAAPDDDAIRALVADYCRSVNVSGATAAEILVRHSGIRLAGVSLDVPAGREKRRGTLGLFAPGPEEPKLLAAVIDERRSKFLKAGTLACDVRRTRYLNDVSAVADIAYRIGGRAQEMPATGVFSKTDGEWRWWAMAPLVPAEPSPSRGDSPLEGTEWRIGEPGTPYSDAMVFDNGLVIAGSSVRKDFYPMEYDFRREGDSVVWSAEMPGNVDQAIVWQGEASGGTMAGRWMRIGIPEGNPLEPLVRWRAVKSR
jgi:hypothetical protein